MMLTEKQKEAICAMLELYKGGSITSDTAITVIEAVFDAASVQYIPLQPYVTLSAYNTEGGQGNG